MKPQPIDAARFWKDLRERSAQGVSLGDRINLLRAQIGYTLRWRAPALLPNGTVKTRIRYEGSEIELPLRMQSDDFVVLLQVFLESEYDWPDIAPGTILDAGGNCGFSTLAMARRYPNARLATIEPEPSNVTALKETLRLNQVAAKLFEAAVTAEDGPVTLNLSNVSGAHSLVAGLRPESKTQVQVPGYSMDTILEALGWDRIGLLKLDIEGYEQILLSRNNRWLSKVDHIVGELHGAYTIKELQEDLEPYGLYVQARPANPRLFVASR